jgi:hypothetical protein
LSLWCLLFSRHLPLPPHSDIRRGISSYGTCMGVFGINSTCTRQSIFVESLDECYLYGDHGYGGVLRCDSTRQFGRLRNAYVNSTLHLAPHTLCIVH